MVTEEVLARELWAPWFSATAARTQSGDPSPRRTASQCLPWPAGSPLVGESGPQQCFNEGRTVVIGEVFVADEAIRPFGNCLHSNQFRVFLGARTCGGNAL